MAASIVPRLREAQQAAGTGLEVQSLVHRTEAR